MVALRLLEVMRDMDLPGELLEDEDPTQTIPRRFGLSDVVERQIRTFKEDVRKRVRLTDEEVQGLFRFVIRRPDSPAVFHRVGRLLADRARPSPWIRLLPRSAQFAIARARARRLLKRLFGRSLGGFARGPFTVEARAHLFIDTDPGGDACHLLSGFTEEVLEQTLGGTARVEHTLCQGRGDDLCRWDGELVRPRATVVEPAERVDEDHDGTAVEAAEARVGRPAPDFTLDSDEGDSVTLSDFRGHKVVLYFYPKDDTPGCTLQACDFRDALPRFDGVDAVVLGVSADDVESHRVFREKYDLNFPLLADVGGSVSATYGVWGKRIVHGTPLMGIERSTFLIDEGGVVERVWRDVSPKGHTEMLADLLGA